MLQKIRDKTQGWIATVIIGAVCVTFALFGIHYYLQGGIGSSQYAAKVNGRTISPQQFGLAYQQMQQQQQQMLAADYSDTPAAQKLLRAQVMEQLVGQAVLTSALLKSGFIVAPGQIDQIIVSMPAFQEDGRFSQARFNNVMQRMMFTQQQFYQELQNQLLVAQLAMGLNNSNYALPIDIKAAIMLLNETRDVGFMVLPLNKFMQQVTVTPDQVNTYYQQHQRNFKTPEQIQLQYIQLPATIAAKNTDAGDQLANLTYENPNSLTVAAEKLNLPVKTTDYFAHNTKNGQGILASKSIIAAAFSDDVLNGGYNSDVITLDDGSQVVLRIATRQPSVIQPLAAVQDKIKTILMKQTAQQTMQQMGDKLAGQLANNGNGADLANALQLSWREKTDVNRHQQNVNPQVLQTVFNMYVPADRQHPSTKTIILPNGNLAVVAFYQAKYGDLKTATPAQIQMFSHNISANYSRVDYALYVRSLMKQAKIKVNQSLITNGDAP